ncbi:MAG: glycosyltransferase 87 family protein [Terriglobales bacterium]
MPSPRERTRFVWNVLLGMLLLLAGAEFLLRGPVRFARNSDFNDFISPYIQTRLWMQGADPYSPLNLVRLWPTDAQRFDFLSRDLANGSLVLKRGIPTAYPLTAFVLLAPVAALPWHVAHPLCLAVTVLSFAVTVTSLLSVAKFPPRTYWPFVFLVLALAFAPFHTALAAGSIVTVAIAAAAAALWAAEHKHDAFAGVLVAVAVALKPQIGLPFLFYYLACRRWRIPAIAIGLVATLFALALARLAISGTPWLQSYLYDNRVLFASGSLGDFTEKNPIRFGLINLQLVAYAIVPDRSLANLLAISIDGILGFVWIFLLWTGKVWRGEKNALLGLSTLLVLSLLPIYHRFYDASLLIFPLAWSTTLAWSPQSPSGRVRVLARASFLLILPFLIPGGSILEQLQNAGHFAALRHWWWWNAVAMPHQVWALFLLALLLLQAMHAATVEEGISVAAGTR